ncbi:MAG: L-malyl-CoA/beta-methylmalyl-CoA lyase [Rhodobiaceae bacterium UBA7378]|nr:MAG: L-malyl-CoA/beta-methylmalyl-CoA lyase [Rhodobiaceae bacterium UBA7378]|tara:strand:+ start:936 stop:1847 length:912 start_codon:yes stop_codon:yes gene_type:complete
MTMKPKRLRRTQLAVPGVSEKMLTKAAAIGADHVFCDLEDAVAPSAKAGARDTIADALNGLDWGKTVRCVRVNDVGTQWCHEDIITLVEKAGANIDTILLPKPLNAADVQFADKLLTQLEMKLGLEKTIGLEVLIEEVEAMQNVNEIARSCARLECMIFGMGDYAASQGLVMKNIGDTQGYPGDIFHYPRYHMTIAARAAGLDAVDGPFVDFNNDAAYREECQRALSLGMVGKWAIHPSQITPAIEIFSPTQDDVDFAREVISVYRKAEAEGIGSVGHKGVMVDAASARLFQNTVDRADLIGM